MLCRFKDKKGQAAVEIAVIASVMIGAFAALIGLTESINRQQNHIQYTFRAHLKAARGGSGGGYVGGNPCDYYYLTPNIPDPYTPGDVSSASASNAVFWTFNDPTDPAPIEKLFNGDDPTPVNDPRWTKTADYKNANIPYRKTLQPDARHSVVWKDGAGDPVYPGRGGGGEGE